MAANATDNGDRASSSSPSTGTLCVFVDAGGTVASAGGLEENSDAERLRMEAFGGCLLSPRN